MTDWTISHDFFYQFGGAERVTRYLSDALGASRIVAISGDTEVEAIVELPNVDHLGGRSYGVRNYRALSLFWPIAVRKIAPIAGNVMSSSYACAHHVRAEGAHIVYCHTPLRQVWSGRDLYKKRDIPTRLIDAAGPALRALDRRAAHRATGYIATDEVVADRIRSYYGIEPLAIIPPPAAPEFFIKNAMREQYVVWAGRIVEPYKRLGLVLDAMRQLPDVTLIVAGDGRDRRALEDVAPSNVKFVGSLPTGKLADLYSRAAGLVFPSEDDFGMVPVEAMASGTPVAALRRGGAVETVVEDVTGTFFDRPEVEDVVEAMKRLLRVTWDHKAIAAHAQQYSVDVFIDRVRAVVDSTLGTELASEDGPATVGFSK
jgi:glycosyltransferase involved in cell wall biosynthesis